MKSLRSFDIYRKVPRDLTEPSTMGGVLSLFAGTILLMLTLLEVYNFMGYTYVDTITVDHSEDGVFQVNFNLSLEGLSCEYAAIDLHNAVGRTREMINDK